MPFAEKVISHVETTTEAPNKNYLNSEGILIHYRKFVHNFLDKIEHEVNIKALVFFKKY